MYDHKVSGLLKEKIELSSVIGKKVNIIRRGNTKVALCPFHSEKTPSFHIHDSKGFYHCFGCGAHGDIITFVMNTEHIGFVEAIEKLSNDYGIELPKKTKLTQAAKEELNEIKEIYRINEITCDYFQKNLLSKNGISCLNYYYKRGLNLQQIKLFRLGYANNSSKDLIDYLKANGIEEDFMLKAGVISSGERGNFDKFRNRAIIPVIDKRGKVIAFTGRALDKDVMPKYMNSPETEIYHKSYVLFNYYFAIDSIFKNKKAIMVEGNFDAISLYVNGVQNVVAPMGTAATIEQFLELWKNVEEIVVCFDGDIAGKKASRRVAEMVLSIISPNRIIKFAFLPEDIDPDDYVRKYGKEGFEKFIKNRNNCYSLSEFLFRDTIKELDIELKNNIITPEEKTRLQGRFELITKKIKDSLVARNFNSFFREEIFKITRFDGKKKVGSYNSITKIKHKKAMGREENILGIEDDIFFLLISDLNLIEMLRERYDVDLYAVAFYSENAAKLLSIFSDACKEDRLDDKKYLSELLEKDNLDYYIKECGNKRTSNYFSSVNTDKERKIRSLYGLIIEKNIAQLQLEIKTLGIRNDNEERRKIITKELDNLYEKKVQLEEEEFEK
ncbi:MAG: DNA primase [Rickettsiales bacterium]|jgi:DNA primase|nr:DNA primase [Rickettsiales bacterium]